MEHFSKDVRQARDCRPSNPRARSWYINMGAVDKDFFTTDAMVKAAL